MKEKIVSQLKAKLTTLGVKNLSNARINAIADKLSTKITDENEIDSKLDELNEIYPFADIAKDDDRLRTLETKDKKPAAQQKTTSVSKDTDDDQQSSDDNDTTKLLKILLGKVETLEKEKKSSSIESMIKGHPKLKDIPQILLKGRAKPEKEEEIDSWIEQVQSDYTEFQQDLVTKGLASNTTPPSTTVRTDNVDADIQAWANKGKQTSSDTKK
jgi:hypothetical protein